MNPSLVSFRAVMLCVMCLLVASPRGLWAAPPEHANPADPNRGKGCLVRDANLVTYLDDDCNFHEVMKNINGSLTLLHYQDHGHLPPEAALPATAVQMILHVDCDCIYDGDYLETITPSGEYHSHGPLKTR
jgi:hypothetical protein